MSTTTPDDPTSRLLDLGRTPPGFEILPSNDEDLLVIRYRQPLSIAAVFGRSLLWLAWTAACVGITIVLVDRPDPITTFIAVGFWMFSVLVLLANVWRFWSYAVFRLRKEELLAEGALGFVRLKHQFRKNCIRRVIQVQSGGPESQVHDGEGFPCWSLYMDTESMGRFILHDQPLEKSSWLGPIIARLADVPFVPFDQFTEHKFGINDRGLDYPFRARRG